MFSAGSERTAQGSRITLSDVIMNMSGIFQCKAQNDEGTIWSNAALTVNRKCDFFQNNVEKMCVTEYGFECYFIHNKTWNDLNISVV